MQNCGVDQQTKIITKILQQVAESWLQEVYVCFTKSFQIMYIVVEISYGDDDLSWSMYGQ